MTECVYIVACHLPRGSKLRLHEDMGVQPIGLQRIRPLLNTNA